LRADTPQCERVRVAVVDGNEASTWRGGGPSSRLLLLADGTSVHIDAARTHFSLRRGDRVLREYKTPEPAPPLEGKLFEFACAALDIDIEPPPVRLDKKQCMQSFKNSLLLPKLRALTERARD